jgi:hypothetical protein
MAMRELDGWRPAPCSRQLREVWPQCEIELWDLVTESEDVVRVQIDEEPTPLGRQ